MNRDLALKTLGEILDWDDTEASEEFAWLKLMSSYKYDGYQGYEPGVHFLESLVGWLLQFDAVKERKVVYTFVRTQLIFFSREEVFHLIHQYSSSLRKYFLKKVAVKNGLKPYEVRQNTAAVADIEKAFRKSLFVGLSDGARMDIFRRYNEGVISNEQIVVGPDISSEKWEDMIKKLRRDIEKRGWNEQPLFENIFLIDDFTASGTTILSKDESGEWGGKLNRFIKGICKDFDTHISPGAGLNIHHYITSEVGERNVTSALAEFKVKETRLDMAATFGYVIGEQIRINPSTDIDLVTLLKCHYDPGIETDSTKENIQMGYKGGALPIVLEHNTPNNSIALLWAESKEGVVKPPAKHMRPLFLRRQRHL